MTSTRNADFAALLLRVSSGALFLAHGLMKVNVFTIPGTIAYFEKPRASRPLRLSDDLR